MELPFGQSYTSPAPYAKRLKQFCHVCGIAFWPIFLPSRNRETIQNKFWKHTHLVWFLLGKEKMEYEGSSEDKSSFETIRLGDVFV